MTVPEVIAKLDTIEREIDRLRMLVRETRHDLFSTLDNDPDELVD